MANEAVCIESPSKIVRYTVADGTSISKGTLLKISSDPNTAAASTAADKFAGVAMMDKVANDGTTEISAALDGTFDIVCAGSAVTLGNMVVISGANLIRDSVEADFPLGAVLGKALETGAASEKIRVRLGHN